MNPSSCILFGRIVNLETFQESCDKKMKLLVKLVGKKIFVASTDSIRHLFVNYVARKEVYPIKTGNATLEDFIGNMSVMRRAFNEWHKFNIVENNILIERGPKQTKTVVRNWKRNHYGDKA